MHDARGRKLKVGDAVIVPAYIMALSENEEYCNVMLYSLFGRRPDGAYGDRE